MTYLCVKSGYDIVLGVTSDNKVELFYYTDGLVYNTQNISSNGKTYFRYQRRSEQEKANLDKIFTKPLNLGNKKLDFALHTPPLLKKDMTEDNHRKSRFINWDIVVKTNKNLIDFYNDYPISADGVFMTKFTRLAETHLSEETKAQIYPSMKELLSGSDQLTNVNKLLSWIQYGFEYQTDEKVWGHDHPFFPEETLYYPYSDTEDRSGLFARLVIDLLGLKTIYLYSEQLHHVAIGVHFTDKDVEGESYIYEGEKYIICDPTYYGASAGKVMKKWATTAAAPIKL